MVTLMFNKLVDCVACALGVFLGLWFLLPFCENCIKNRGFYLKKPSPLFKMGRDSSVGIATRCGLDGPGIESRWGRDFPHPSRPALGPTQPPTQWVPGLKRPGRGVDHPPTSSAEVKERVKLYLYSLFGPS
jgi:hypothetical protein